MGRRRGAALPAGTPCSTLNPAPSSGHPTVILPWGELLAPKGGGCPSCGGEYRAGGWACCHSSPRKAGLGTRPLPSTEEFPEPLLQGVLHWRRRSASEGRTSPPGALLASSPPLSPLSPLMISPLEPIPIQPHQEGCLWRGALRQAGASPNPTGCQAGTKSQQGPTGRSEAGQVATSHTSAA